MDKALLELNAIDRTYWTFLLDCLATGNYPHFQRIIWTLEGVASTHLLRFLYQISGQAAMPQNIYGV